MKVGHIDGTSGVSGDMLLGAIIDAGVPLTILQDAIDAVGIEVNLQVERVTRRGMAGTHVQVIGPAAPERLDWADIRERVATSEVSASVRDKALAVFRRLAEAEAAVHGVSTDRVHFHEVGAADTIADIVGTCAGIVALKVERLTCGPLATGRGTTEAEHGRLPLPAPAVLHLLRGRPIHGLDTPFETVTPTGAALVAELTEPVSTFPSMWVDGHGVGAGSRDLEHPNVLRLILGHERSPLPQRDAVVLEATVDDLSPQFVPLILDRLRAEGAQDSWATPTLMKKGRPGFTLTALCTVETVSRLQEILLRESSSIGCRTYFIRKTELERESITVPVLGHEVRVKLAHHDQGVVNLSPEFEDVRRVSESVDLPAREVHELAAAAARAWLKDQDR